MKTDEVMQTHSNRWQQYHWWIRTNYPTAESARLECEKATNRMVREFPELTRVRGLASVEEPYDLPPTRTPHWWCKTLYGEVVDPTGHQYPTKILEYHEADESRGPPTGKCPNCGGLCYGGFTCSEKCEKKFAEYLGV